MAAHVFKLGGPSSDGTMSGKVLRHLLLMSGLAKGSLARIWELADEHKAGKLSQEQVVKLLGMLSLVQAGQAPDPAAVSERTTPPLLKGLAPPTEGTGTQ
jgi:hypothetical protein